MHVSSLSCGVGTLTIKSQYSAALAQGVPCFFGPRASFSSCLWTLPGIPRALGILWWVNVFPDSNVTYYICTSHCCNSFCVSSLLSHPPSLQLIQEAREELRCGCTQNTSWQIADPLKTGRAFHQRKFRRPTSVLPAFEQKIKLSKVEEEQS